MTERPTQRFIAMEAKYPGSWGASPDGAHQAIAFACDAGADRLGVFLVYDAYDGCYVIDMGGLVWLEDHGEPKLDGIYDAAGSYLADTINELLEDIRKGYIEPEERAFHKDAIRHIKPTK